MRKPKDNRVAVIDLPGNRQARIAPESEAGKGGGSKPLAVTRVVDQLVYERLLKDTKERKYASERAAAERMHTNYVKGGLVPIKAQAYEIIDNNAGETAETVANAKDRYFKDLKLLEPRGASVVHNICGEDKTATQWAKENGVSRVYAVERLKEALGSIAKRHGL